jgi:hypothetical protein
MLLILKQKVQASSESTTYVHSYLMNGKLRQKRNANKNQSSLRNLNLVLYRLGVAWSTQVILCTNAFMEETILGFSFHFILFSSLIVFLCIYDCADFYI